ncbi:MAG TPA: hypothetical protein VGR62_01575 [Candidatus Binatia bacterium]|nr:hypothetical protein [Candidatus Binatia bacterium]
MIICGRAGIGGLVDLASLSTRDFAALPTPLSVEALLREIARYDAADATAVSRQVRANARRARVDALVGWYREAMAAPPADHREVLVAMVSSVMELMPPRDGRADIERDRLRHDVHEADRSMVLLVAERDGLQARLAEALDGRAALERVVTDFEQSLAVRVRGYLHRVPGYGALARLLRRA